MDVPCYNQKRFVTVFGDRVTLKSAQFSNVFNFLFFKNFFYKLPKEGDFFFTLETWRTSKYAFKSIFLASLIINILSLAFPLTLLQVYDRIIPNVAYSTLVFLSAGVVITLLIEAGLKIARSYVGAWSDAKFQHIMGCEAFKHIIHSRVRDFEKEGAGVHLKRLNALGAMRDFYTGQAVISMADIPFLVLLLVIIAYIAKWLVLVSVVMLVVFVFSTIFQTKNLRHILDDRQEHEDRRLNFIIETLSNIHTVKSLTLEAQMLRRY